MRKAVTQLIQKNSFKTSSQLSVKQPVILINQSVVFPLLGKNT